MFIIVTPRRGASIDALFMHIQLIIAPLERKESGWFAARRRNASGKLETDKSLHFLSSWQ
ncbi:MAG: hypothetical protein GY820_09635 [Gammaproteobacteria bacterium]|nr:hypothetical protein [Gammaproteobacteria bacterium]